MGVARTRGRLIFRIYFNLEFGGRHFYIVGKGFEISLFPGLFGLPLQFQIDFMSFSCSMATETPSEGFSHVMSTP